MSRQLLLVLTSLVFLATGAIIMIDSLSIEIVEIPQSKMFDMSASNNKAIPVYRYNNLLYSTPTANYNIPPSIVIDPEPLPEPSTTLKPEFPALNISGSLIDENGKIWFYITSPKSLRLTRIGLNDSIDGWVLVSIKEKKLTFIKDGYNHEISR